MGITRDTPADKMGNGFEKNFNEGIMNRLFIPNSQFHVLK